MTIVEMIAKYVTEIVGAKQQLPDCFGDSEPMQIAKLQNVWRKLTHPNLG